MNCPFCQSENASNVLVCACCARDIAIPPSLIAERDSLIQKRDAVKQELTAVRNELNLLRQGRKNRPA